jgi:hypothetical protein
MLMLLGQICMLMVHEAFMGKFLFSIQKQAVNGSFQKIVQIESKM